MNSRYGRVAREVLPAREDGEAKPRRGKDIEDWGDIFGDGQSGTWEGLLKGM